MGRFEMERQEGESEESFQRRVRMKTMEKTCENQATLTDLSDTLSTYTTKADKNEQRSTTNRRFIAGVVTLFAVPLIGGAIALAYQSIQIRNAATQEGRPPTRIELERDEYNDRTAFIRNIEQGKYDGRLDKIETIELENANRQSVLKAIARRRHALNTKEVE
jgi:hypothetical protein